MTERIPDEKLDHIRESYRGILADTKAKGQTYAPVKHLEDNVKALDELAERRKEISYRPCRACGERGYLVDGYCRDHS